MEEHPGRKVFILDSMSTGPEQAMVCDKLRQLAESGLEPEEVYAQALDYHAHTHTLFCLESLNNLARNGRINPAVAKLAGVLGAESGLDPEAGYAEALDYHAHSHTLFCLESLHNLARNGRISPAVAKLAGGLGIRVGVEAKEAQIAPVHKARGMKKAVQVNLARNGRISPAVAKLAGGLGIRVGVEAKEAQIAPVHKARGMKKAVQVLLDMVTERGFQDGSRLRIAHCFAQGQFKSCWIWSRSAASRMAAVCALPTASPKSRPRP